MGEEEGGREAERMGGGKQEEGCKRMGEERLEKRERERGKKRNRQMKNGDSISVTRLLVMVWGSTMH